MRAQVWGVGLVRNEIDILAYTLDHLLTQSLDGILIADNMSDDGTREMILEYARRYPVIHPLDDKQTAWYQSKKMSALCQMAHERGAEWVLPFDADEWWTTDDGSTVGDAIRSSPHSLIGAPIINYSATQRDDPAVLNPFKRIQWRNGASPLVKCAILWQPGLKVMEGNHGVLSGYERVMSHPHKLVCKHLAHRSEQHFVDVTISGGKALKATNLPEDFGGHWRNYYKHYEATGEQGLRDWWRLHFCPADPQSKGLIHDPIQGDA